MQILKSLVEKQAKKQTGTSELGNIFAKGARLISQGMGDEQQKRPPQNRDDRGALEGIGQLVNILSGGDDAETLRKDHVSRFAANAEKPGIFEKIMKAMVSMAVPGAGGK